MKVLVLDNYDSFTYNLVHLLRELGHGDKLEVRRNDEISLAEVAEFDKILLSPGPGIPSEAGRMMDILHTYGTSKHFLGVCLGHQGIAEAFGGKLYNLSEVLHGIASEVSLTGVANPLFEGLPASFQIGRYHSWCVEKGSLNGQFDVLATDKEGEIMALRHKKYPVYGVQFHPESVITDFGKQLLANWLAIPIEPLPIPQHPHHTPSPAAMKDILHHLFDHQTLDQDEAKSVLTNIAKGGIYNPAQIAAFMTVYIMRGITVEELSGFREAMLELCIPVELTEFDPIDLCGTGGDGKNTFNVSTLASFVAAGAGAKVAKHGNYGVSSVSGSSNVIEFLGGSFSKEPDVIRQQIEEAGICFLHAPKFHPAMKNVGPIRRELGVKTFFNMLGPMVNPAFPKKQMVGVFSLELARLYGYIYQQTDKQFSIVHALDGYDEVSLTGAFKTIDNEGDHVYQPQDIGFDTLQPTQLLGGESVEDAAKIFLDVLEGRATAAQQAVVMANAGMALHTYFPNLSISEAIDAAKESLVSGQALRSFKKFISIT